MNRARSSPPYVMAVGFLFRLASYVDARQLAPELSRTISRMQVAYGLTKLRSAKGTWSGVVSLKTFLLSAANWSPPFTSKTALAPVVHARILVCGCRVCTLRLQTRQP